MFEDSANRMKGLGSDVGNALIEYKLTVHIKKRDVLAALIAASKRASTDERTVKSEIDNNIDVQDKAAQQNVFRLAEIEVKEGIAEGITKIVRRYITNAILRTMDNSNFNLVDQYQIDQLFTAIMYGAE